MRGARNQGITCIVPAFNEAARIARVLEVATAHPAIGAVIVIDDGSSDGTAKIAAGVAGVEVVRMPQNGGKSLAVATGLALAETDFVALLDADLAGLTVEDLDRLLTPVLDGAADCAISLRRNAPFPWRWIGLDYISGERVFRRDLVAGRLEEIGALARFGLEVWMNGLLLQARTPIAVVRWPGVSSPLKLEKMGVMRGVLADLRMLGDIFRQISPVTAARQILGMRALRRV